MTELEQDQAGTELQSISIDEAVQRLSDVQRDELGRFTRVDDDAQEADAVADEGEALAEPESAEAEVAVDEEPAEAPDEGQPEQDIPLPPSWSADDADLWSELTPAARAKVFAREAAREAAVNAKFQEAASARKSAEEEARRIEAIRAEHLQAIEAIKSVVVPKAPPRSMLHPDSPDYNPDAYHAQRAAYEESLEIVQNLEAQQRYIAAQRQAEEMKVFEQIEAQYRPKLIEMVPSLADPAKAPAVISELSQYAISAGVPAEALQNATSVEVMLLWKAKQYDEMQKAKAAVAKAAPAPKAKVATIAPNAKPAAASSAKAASFSAAMERLSRTGSFEDALAALKSLER